MNIFRKNYHRITVWYHGYSVLLKWHGGKPFLEISETHAYVEAHMRMLRHRVGNVESAATQILNPGVKSVSIRYETSIPYRITVGVKVYIYRKDCHPLANLDRCRRIWVTVRVKITELSTALGSLSE